MPINIIIILLLLALFFYKSRPSLSFKSLFLATFILVFSTFPPTADPLMSALENNYDAFTVSDKPIDYIIVLGCGHTTDNALPATSELKTCSLQRLVEAVRIARIHPEARLIMSGASGDDPTPNAEKMKQAAMLLGIKENKLITESYPKDTEEEAELIAPRVLNTHVVLVTNADHMPRSIKYFKAQGIDAIPAPTGYWVKDNGEDKYWAHYFPSANKLNQTTTAWYETLGRVVQWVKSLF